MSVLNYFTHLEDNLEISINVIDANNVAIPLANTGIEFAVAFDSTSNTIQTLTLSNGISIVDANTSSILINFNPTKAIGFNDRNLIYQVKLVDQVSNTTSTYQYGRIFISPSLFD